MSKDLAWAGGVRRASTDRNVGYATSVGVQSGSVSSSAPASRKRPPATEREGLVASITPLEPKRDDTVTRANGRIKTK